MFNKLIIFVSVITTTSLLIVVAIAVVAKKRDLIKFWLFLKFGIQFKDKTEMVENLSDIDYDAFINYK